MEENTTEKFTQSEEMSLFSKLWEQLVKKEDFSFIHELSYGDLQKIQEVSRKLCIIVHKETQVGSVALFTEQCLSHLMICEYKKKNAVGVSTTVLYGLYEIWCEIQRIECMTQTFFTKNIKELGYHKDKGKCLVKSYATGQVKNKQQIFFHCIPEIKDIQLQKQIREKIHEKLLECDQPQDSEEYQQLHALKVWFDKDK